MNSRMVFRVYLEKFIYEKNKILKCEIGKIKVYGYNEILSKKYIRKIPSRFSTAL